MPNEVTAYLTLDRQVGLGSSRKPVALLWLDEGFDRPHWKSLIGPSRTWRPDTPELILETGLLALLSDLQQMPGPSNNDQDLSEALPQFGSAKAALAQLDDSYSISLHIYDSSSLKQAIDEFANLPVRTHLLVEAARPEAQIPKADQPVS